MSFKTVRYTFSSEKLRENLRFVLLSDLHNSEHGPHNRDLIAKIMKLKPDLILCAGDMAIARKNETAEGIHVLRELATIAPVAFANGNHESKLHINYHTDFERVRAELESAGVVFLNNRSQEFTVRGETVVGYGLEIPVGLYKKFRIHHFPVEEMRDFLGQAPDGDHFSFLIAHNPQFMPAYLQWGTDLTVCGHFHGGIMRITKHQVLISPYGFPLPRFGYGMYMKEGRRGIVTSGLGDHAVDLRIHNPMELVVIDVAADGRNVRGT